MMEGRGEKRAGLLNTKGSSMTLEPLVQGEEPADGRRIGRSRL